MDKEASVDVIIPTYRPDESLFGLIKELNAQSVPPARIILINTEQSFFKKLQESDGEGVLKDTANLTIIHVTKAEFDHAGTRNGGVAASTAPYFLMMTQDARPRDRRLISVMLSELTGDSDAAAVYARQYPKPDCNLEERYLRKFNYPSEGMRKTVEDLDRLGIKTYFCSNVCAMYNRRIFDEVGGFHAPAIFNEDMVYAAAAMKKGYAIRYAAEAGVIHSHNYTLGQQFRRNFDLGVSQTDHPEVFEGISSESEGIRMVKQTIAHFSHIGQGLAIPHYILMCGSRFLGYRLGRGYRRLPSHFIRVCTMNRDYWDRIEENRSEG